MIVIPSTNLASVQILFEIMHGLVTSQKNQQWFDLNWFDVYKVSDW